MIQVVDDVLESAAALLENLCAISTATGDVDGLRRCARLLGRELVDLGFHVEIENRPNVDDVLQPVLIATSRPSSERNVLLIGHLDTVLPATAARRTDDRLEGTGALDMKGGFAALVGALRLRWSQGLETPAGLNLVAVPDEEIGGPISEAVVRQLGRDASAVLVLEPGRRCESGETIVTGRRGLSVWRLDARGRAAHSGLAFAEGRSALAAAAEWSAGAQGLSEDNGGPIVNVGRIIGGDSEFVQDLGEEHRFVGTSQRLNVVADRCLVEGEARYLTTADRDRVLERMRRRAHEAAESWGVDIQFEVVEEIRPVPPSDSSAELARLLVEAASADGWTLEVETDRGGVSFPNFLPDPSAVPVIDGLGPVGDGMHTREEYVSLASLDRRIHLIAHLLDALSE
ncbi:MAG: M20/M25/M40 family metallo-hydrolase [Candidatus Sulfomarinibacteraceae bacterium]